MVKDLDVAICLCPLDVKVCSFYLRLLAVHRRFYITSKPGV